jgi:hypothetical protein
LLVTYKMYHHLRHLAFLFYVPEEEAVSGIWNFGPDAPMHRTAGAPMLGPSAIFRASSYRASRAGRENDLMQGWKLSGTGAGEDDEYSDAEATAKSAARFWRRVARRRKKGPALYLPCTFPVPSLYLPCTFPVPSRAGARRGPPQPQLSRR